MDEPLIRRERAIVSPLRYPGAKRRFAGYVGEVLRLNGLTPDLFVEPFAGGASVALELLSRGRVGRIALGEADPLVAAFWQAVHRRPEQLIARLMAEAVTVDTWQRYRDARPRDLLGRAAKCLFLNRTNFSGILSPTAGPIGGRAQAGRYPIDCRFPRPTLAKRIRQVAALADRIAFVHCGDYRDTIRRAAREARGPGGVFYYLDPPFYAKADRLYTYYFREADHAALRDEVEKLSEPWLLSYDPAPAIQKLYSGRPGSPARVDLLYSASGGEVVRGQELLITNLPELPRQTRLWRSSREWAAPIGRPTPPAPAAGLSARPGDPPLQPAPRPAPRRGA